MTKEEKINNFDPSGVGIKNGNFIGLPFNEEEADIVLLPVPWDVTVSFAEGTATGAENILDSSYQLDLALLHSPGAWKKGIFFQAPNKYWSKRSKELRENSNMYISYLENFGKVSESAKMLRILEEINFSSETLKRWVREESKKIFENGKKVGLIGGDHSCPLGTYEAAAAHYGEFGILQIDAHQDLRKAYEGFTYSHASIFYNALQIKEISRLVQVGIRDFCEEETAYSRELKDRVSVFYDQKMREEMYGGKNYSRICEEIIAALPEKVWISFDIDGLQAEFCPNTGTPVPGGLSFNEACYLIRKVKESGREVIGFDLCEVAGLGNDWDGNVGARVAYHLCSVL